MSFKRIVLLGLMVVLAVGQTSNSQAPSKQKSRYNYLLYVPKDYDTQSGNYPLVVYLHGSSQRGDNLARLKAYGPPSMVEKGREYPFFIVSPQCPEGKSWSTDDWFDSLYAELLANYRIDTSRIYLTGVSMGGDGAWSLAMQFPTRFAAVAPLCGGYDDPDQICRIRQVPIWAFHGTADNVVPIVQTERLVSRLQACKANIKYNRMENAGHGIQYLYAENTIYDWMLTHKK